MLFMSNTSRTPSGYVFPVFVLICLALLGMGFFSFLPKHDINIEVSENEESISVTASFPAEKSSSVYEYLRSEMDVSDLGELHWLEIKEYETPDKKMRFHIKTRIKLLMIEMNKKENSLPAQAKLREFGDGLKHVLAVN